MKVENITIPSELVIDAMYDYNTIFLMTEITVDYQNSIVTTSIKLSDRPIKILALKDVYVSDKYKMDIDLFFLQVLILL